MNLDEAKEILLSYLKEAYCKESHHVSLATALSYLLGVVEKQNENPNRTA